MLEVKEVVKKFGNVVALDNASFTIDRGQVVGLLGPNGAGKTTCMRVMTGFFYPERGDVLYNSESLFASSNKIKSHIGYLPENNPLYSDLTVKEYLYYIAELKGIKELSKKVLHTATSVGLKEVFLKEINSLSKGYKQRVGLAQALLGDPDVLILDEPTEGLDPNQREEIRELIKRVGKERTVVISSHVLSEVSKLCDRVVIINKGKIIKDSKVKDLEVGEEVEIYAKIKGVGVTNVLKKLKGASMVAKESMDNFIITSKKGVDLRSEITKLCVKNKWDLLEIYTKKRSLEEVFKELTN